MRLKRHKYFCILVWLNHHKVINYKYEIEIIWEIWTLDLDTLKDFNKGNDHGVIFEKYFLNIHNETIFSLYNIVLISYNYGNIATDWVDWTADIILS